MNGGMVFAKLICQFFYFNQNMEDGENLSRDYTPRKANIYLETQAIYMPIKSDLKTILYDLTEDF